MLIKKLKISEQYVFKNLLSEETDMKEIYSAWVSMAGAGGSGVRTMTNFTVYFTVVLWIDEYKRLYDIKVWYADM